MDTISQNALQHGSMVLDLAMERAICNHTASRRIDMQELLSLEMEIAFDELKAEHRWAWTDLQELRSAHHRALGEYEEKTMKNLERQIKNASKDSQ